MEPRPVSADVKDFCRGIIAHYKVPRYVRFTDALPMTITGKVQKFKMRGQSIEEQSPSRSSRSPQRLTAASYDGQGCSRRVLSSSMHIRPLRCTERYCIRAFMPSSMSSDDSPLRLALASTCKTLDDPISV